MRIAILTDIHANREAFTAVLQEVSSLGVERIVMLGDIVGYGPDPLWCWQKARDLVAAGAVCVMGNHDWSVANHRDTMNDLARASMAWTRQALPPEAGAWLATRPMAVAEEDRLYVHASADHPEDWIYVTSAARALPSFRATEARLIFCGHTHVPLLATCDLAGRVTEQRIVSGAPVPLLTSRRWLAVAGAVGQPRDGVSQAGWVLLDLTENCLSFRRTPYDAAQTAAKIRAAGLPEPLARRLIEGA